ncbi:MAG TPA: hypothetical protein VGD67_20510 [Pseudonocardiaceae bacterium]
MTRVLRALLVTLAVGALAMAGPGTASAAGLTLSGPSVVTANGNYTYRADLHAFYQHYQWHTRTCPTTSVTACAATWQYARTASVEVGPDSYTRFLSRDCTGGGTRSFQVRVVASGFNTPAETAYLATRLCYDPL